MSEIRDAFAALPPPRAHCIVSVAIPARNESDCIALALEALAAQRAGDGGPLDPDAYEIIVFANGCTDDTGPRVRAFAARHERLAVHVVEASLPSLASHIGHARRAVMHAAAARMRTVTGRGIVASTDADTRVSPNWIANTIAELRAVEAVGGRVLPEPPSGPGAASDACAYALEHRYQYAVVRLETLLDPIRHDPWPRHANHQGASFALYADTYTRVGGTPAVPVLEDFALYDALMRAGVRFRHSLRVRVITSGRRTGRVKGGFASYLQSIDEHVAGGATHVVEHPNVTIARNLGRGAVRRADAALAAHAYGLARETVVRHMCETATIGIALEVIEKEARASGALCGYARVPIEYATRVLDDYRAESSPSEASSACAARPTRINA